jgi:hypothetical protein
MSRTAFTHFTVMSKSHDEIVLQNNLNGKRVRIFHAIAPSLYSDVMVAEQYDVIRLANHRLERKIDC